MEDGNLTFEAFHIDTVKVGTYYTYYTYRYQLELTKLNRNHLSYDVLGFRVVNDNNANHLERHDENVFE